MKKIFLKIYTIFNHLFYGLHSADKIAFGQNANTDDVSGGAIEIKDEADSVYKDLLKGEVTQEVRELRHEMYYSERESHKFEYSGGGRVKKVGLFEDTPDLPHMDGYRIQIVQDNTEDTGGVADNLSEDDYRIKNEREYTINIDRDFMPRFKLEEFTNKIVVERGEGDKVIIDLYVSKYDSQFNRRHKPFLNELKRIIEGDRRSEIIDFDRLSFTSYKAWGANDLNVFKYCLLKYKDTFEYKGDYVLSFEGIVESEKDVMTEYYDEIANRKSENHEARNGNVTIDYMSVINKEKDNELAEEQNNLIAQFKQQN